MKQWYLGLICWLLGHDPDFTKCQKIVIPYREKDYGLLLVQFMGRIIYFGATTCKRCGEAQHIKPS